MRGSQGGALEVAQSQSVNDPLETNNTRVDPPEPWQCQHPGRVAASACCHGLAYPRGTLDMTGIASRV